MHEITLTEPQSEMFLLECRFPLFVAGYGSGKTFAMAVNCLNDALSFRNVRVAAYCPTFDLMRLNFIPMLEELLTLSGINYELNKTIHIIKLFNGSEIIMRSMSRPETIIGYSVFRSHVDEIDIMILVKAEDIHKKIIARNRAKVFSGGELQENRISFYTTPDHGFKSFTYSRWANNETEKYKYIRASTDSNPHNPPDYVEILRETYSDEYVDAYINGIWCNLLTGTVYRNFDRDRNSSEEEIKGKEALYIGMDFNVTKMASTIYVKRGREKKYSDKHKGPGFSFHATDEFYDIFDTPDMINAIKERYPDNPKIVYPDASGDNRKSVDATKTDISLLKEHKFSVRVKKTNPLIRERVLSLNLAFLHGLVFVNTKKCKRITECLEQQPYGTDGLPDKTNGLDHQNDATGYPVVYEMPVKRNTPIFSGISSAQ